MAQSKNQKRKSYSVDNANESIKNLVNEYGTQTNLLKGLGIAAGVGVLAWAAYRFIPFDRLFSKIEEAYDENFGENENKQELANVEE